ncbi:Lrp/AsnC family transcriptional regulator [Pseudoteredinibacter isoporae]|uniref:Lrp/AsnC family transcriptional regulator n=1 Tax=Pseudoteredinibacter isoporae TaxID=570281 RepID=A0A7X0JVT3_9GAMM|nr:Lrp/AsnC family transcriptional regulator [Pseudoteredinibacter isoporae]MBB6523117.1 Lrp/AsnC family transcriptional regulator [Pseudoteredinibacter isoporae]NHO88637.1 Lrp/AsnC family transcriptional regulator [Pseudoteredinibacter isoporae]NIB22672.1 Lrp/AsnC family transcriptional regulator [Pseudoteredinibacter isoporae]
MDKIDKQLLEALQKDASRSIGTIAEDVGISKTAAWRRIKKLISDGVIKSQVALLDAEKLGLPLTAYIALRTSQHNAEWFNRFKDVLNTIPEVLEAYRMSGDLDYLVKAQVSDMAGYDRLYKQLIKAELNDVSCSFVMETLKHTTRLPIP